MDAVDIKIEVVEDNDVDPSDNNNTRLNPVTELPLALVKRKERDITERQKWQWELESWNWFWVYPSNNIN